MNRRLWALIAAGAAARLLAWMLRPALHPDEVFQYLEPAWQRLHGYGWPPWEWAAGVRSWILPGYHGAWMVILGWLGIEGGAAAHAFFQLHWAAASLLLIPAAWRAGEKLSGSEEGGFRAAALCALLPTLVWFAPHTLTEVPSAILMTWGYAAAGASAIGILFSSAVCLRIPNAPLALPVLFSWRAIPWALLPLAAFGMIDWITWGRPFHSAIGFLDYNFVQGRAVEHGRSPPFEYFAWIWSRLGPAGAVLFFAPIALRIRFVWRCALPAALLVVLLSTQGHKEERFLLAAWPLFAIAWGAAVAPLRRAAVAAALVAICASNAHGIWRGPVHDYSGRAGLFAAQSWVGEQPDATGLLVEGRFHLSGGFFLLRRNLPLETWAPALARNPIFNYAALPDGMRPEGFSPAWSRRGWTVWKRKR